MRKKTATLVVSDKRGLLSNKAIKVAKTLSNSGYFVKILVWDKSGKSSLSESYEGIEIINFRFKPLRLGAFSLYGSYFIWMVYVFIFLIKNDSEIFHPENLPALLPAILAKILKRKILIYDMADFLADSLNWPPIIRDIIAILEKSSLRFADGVIIIGEHRKSQIVGAKIKRLSVIFNCPSQKSLNNLMPVQKDDHFLIYYGGLLSESRGIRTICESVKNFSDIRIIVAGFGPDEKKLLPLFNEIKNINFLGFIDSRSSLELTKRASLMPALYDPQLVLNRLASPGKIFDAMMCKTPVLVNSEAIAIAEIVRKENCGLIIPYGNKHEIKNAINILKGNKELIVEMGNNGYQAFLKEYNWEIMEGRLLALYEDSISAALK